MVGHGVDRGIGEVAVETVVVRRKARDGADRVADLEALRARTERGNGPGRLVTQASGQLGVFQVLPAAEHRLGAVQSQRLDADLDFALPGWGNLNVFKLMDFRAADLVKPHDARHVSLL